MGSIHHEKTFQDVINRFWSKVKKGNLDECWERSGSDNGNGYNQLKIKGVPILSHRFSWIIHKGQIPNGLKILHKCDNRRCVNPNHLFLGTQLDNIRDMINKGRRIKKWSSRRV